MPINVPLRSRTPFTGREWMAPVKFAYACAACHLLIFDQRFEEGVPHDKPEVVHQFVVRRFRDYLAAHPAEMRVVREPDRNLTGKPLPPAVRALTAEQWIAERTAEAENLLWRKTCNQCHSLYFQEKDSPARISQSAATNEHTSKISPAAVVLPVIEHANTTLRWMPHARFDHDAHGGFACTSCHQKTLTSTEASDVLLPGIAICQKCHAPGPEHAESRCFECHVYHDWSRRKEITPAFTLPALRSGGR